MSDDQKPEPAAIVDLQAIANTWAGRRDIASARSYYRTISGEASLSAAARQEDLLPKLDWIPNHDERSRGFGVDQVVDVTAPLERVAWSVFAPALNQGAEGACAGMATAGSVNVHRVSNARTELAAGLLLREEAAVRLYKRAQELDEWAGSDYSGTSVTAAMKAAREAGLIGSYRWAFGTRQLAHGLRTGPAVIGVPWLAGMYSTDPRGVVQVTGKKVGGHALVVVGFDPKHPLTGGPAFDWLNSWGPSYGRAGVGVIPAGRLSWLLAGRGECAFPNFEPAAST